MVFQGLRLAVWDGGNLDPSILYSMPAGIKPAVPLHGVFWLGIWGLDPQWGRLLVGRVGVGLGTGIDFLPLQPLAFS